MKSQTCHGFTSSANVLTSRPWHFIGSLVICGCTDTLFSNYHWWLYTNLGTDTLLCHLGYRVLREYEDSDRVLLFRVLSIPAPAAAAAAATAAAAAA